MYHEADIQLTTKKVDDVKFQEQITQRAGRWWGYLLASHARLLSTADATGILPMLVAGAKAVGYDKIFDRAFQEAAYAKKEVRLILLAY